MRHYVYGTVRETRRSAIYAIRVKGDAVDPIEADEIAELMRDKMLARGESAADVVVVTGDDKATLRLYGAPHAVARVRSAMFNAAIGWAPIDLD
ncbi:MAG TPA: hypothetical protein VFW22_02205 [Pseudolabrys sp.]|nr:hypothetical protein [Pseudolabrys sp.]